MALLQPSEPMLRAVARSLCKDEPVQMQAQGVPKVLGAGSCFDDLLPFVAMERVVGIPLESEPSSSNAAAMHQVGLSQNFYTAACFSLRRKAKWCFSMAGMCCLDHCHPCQTCCAKVSALPIRV